MDPEILIIGWAISVFSCFNTKYEDSKKQNKYIKAEVLVREAMELREQSTKPFNTAIRVLLERNTGLSLISLLHDIGSLLDYVATGHYQPWQPHSPCVNGHNGCSKQAGWKVGQMTSHVISAVWLYFDVENKWLYRLCKNKQTNSYSAKAV